ncbi:MAG TPA: penicillin-binding protein 2 [Anaerolineaceae bacterium]
MIQASFKRYQWVSGLLILVGLIIFIWLVRIQTSEGAKEFRDGMKRRFEIYSDTVRSNRGSIYDRWGNPLATNREVYEVGVDLRYIADKDIPVLVQTLSQALGWDAAKVKKEISRKYDPKVDPYGYYVFLSGFVPSENVAVIKEKRKQLYQEWEAAPNRKKGSIPSLFAIVYQPKLIRTYPEGSLGSNILGLYLYAQEKPVGYLGVEEYYNDLLSGITVNQVKTTNPYNTTVTDVPPGADLILTIDRDVQAMIEKVLDNAVARTGATAGVIVVLDPRNGEILGMASSGRVDLNNYGNLSKDAIAPANFNRAISRTYEPGSVFKVLTMASGLDSGAVRPDSVYQDTGRNVVGGITIYNWDRIGHGPQTMQGCLQLSLNTCLSWVAQQIKPTRFFEYLNRFGIGRPSNIDLAGEVIYPLSTVDGNRIPDSNLGTNAFGQGVSVNVAQMVMAVSALANDGKMFAPHVLKSYVDNGRQITPQPKLVDRPISAETARTITELLARSLENESSKALVEGYRVAGKTGTAEIAGPGGYLSNATNASFVGWGPVDNPRFLVYVWLEKPTTSPWGSIVASPVFKEVTEKLVILLDIPPDAQRQKLASQ